MSYRDDRQALYLRAEALQREVDRLTAELAAARAAPPSPPPPPPLTLSEAPSGSEARSRRALTPSEAPTGSEARSRRARDERFPSPDAVRAAMRRRRPPSLWVPPEAATDDEPSAQQIAALLRQPAADDAPAEAAAPTDTRAELGLLVARLTRSEHAIVAELLTLLTDDDFSPEAVARNLDHLDELLGALRARLRRPG